MGRFARLHRRRSPALALIIAALLLQGCESATEPPLRVSFDEVVQIGILEGPNTFLLRKLDSNDAYYPLNLPTEFHVEGVRVRVKGLLIRDYQVLLHTLVEILSISRLPE